MLWHRIRGHLIEPYRVITSGLAVALAVLVRQDSRRQSMTVTNDPTGRRSTCTGCGAEVEEAMLLKGLRSRYVDGDGREKFRISPGVPTWRTLDRGHAGAVCPSAPDGVHQPGRIRMTSAR